MRKQVIKKFKDARREYIRQRDGQGEFTQCISCQKWEITKNMHVGHYYHGDLHNEITGDERNINLQCAQCNYHKNGNIQGYAVGMVKKYGADILTELEQKKKAKYWKLEEIKNLTEYYKKPPVKNRISGG